MKRHRIMVITGIILIALLVLAGCKPEPETPPEIKLPAKAELVEGTTKQLEITLVPEDAEMPAVAWTSSDETVATVSDSGLVTAKSPGTADITAETKDGLKAACRITVKKKVPVSSITLDKTTLGLLDNRERPEPLIATVLPENADYDKIVWTSSDENVVKVSQTGVISSVNPGTATITASAGGKKATCTITVIWQTPDELSNIIYVDTFGNRHSFNNKGTYSNDTETSSEITAMDRKMKTAEYKISEDLNITFWFPEPGILQYKRSDAAEGSEKVRAFKEITEGPTWLSGNIWTYTSARHPLELTFGETGLLTAITAKNSSSDINLVDLTEDIEIIEKMTEDSMILGIYDGAEGEHKGQVIERYHLRKNAENPAMIELVHDKYTHLDKISGEVKNWPLYRKDVGPDRFRNKSLINKDNDFPFDENGFILNYPFTINDDEIEGRYMIEESADKAVFVFVLKKNSKNYNTVITVSNTAEGLYTVQYQEYLGSDPTLSGNTFEGLELK